MLALGHAYGGQQGNLAERTLTRGKNEKFLGPEQLRLEANYSVRVG
jgi:hypothetical protein